KEITGSYQLGFVIFAALAILALGGLTGVKTRWRTTWGAAHLTAAKI
ncbi:MAG: MFS transporter, partial [Candidatus Accumulibacter sp.]|nr:MFS transporter [Accumulibacter sp.]